MRYACSTHALYSAGVSRPIISVRLRISVLRLRQLSLVMSLSYPNSIFLNLETQRAQRIKRTQRDLLRIATVQVSVLSVFGVLCVLCVSRFCSYPQVPPP